MRASLARVLDTLARAGRAPPAIASPVDALVQKFENCRAALSDEALRSGGAEPFFAALYQQEREALRDALRMEQPHLTPDAREQVFQRVDELVRDVVVPAYARLAARFTRRERNAFYLAPDPLHGAERVGWTVVGIALGGFAIWAPFIPLWSKEWVFVFFLGGLFFPEARRFVEIRRYERELNALVARAEQEVGRIDVRYLLREPAEDGGEREAPRGDARTHG
jgi:hypothetical protein